MDFDLLGKITMIWLTGAIACIALAIYFVVVR